ncbi:hypothetical protein ACJX0J_026058, partial [Zea mays]
RKNYKMLIKRITVKKMCHIRYDTAKIQLNDLFNIIYNKLSHYLNEYKISLLANLKIQHLKYK